jgi:hypothetical protein
MDASETDLHWWMNVVGMVASSCRQALSAWEKEEDEEESG